MAAYMGQDDFTSHKHQVIHADPGPISTAAVAAYAQLCADLPCLVEKKPYLLALLDSAPAAGSVCAIVEDERDHDLGSLDGRAHHDEVLSRELCLLCFTLQSGFGHNARLQADGGVGAQFLLLRRPALGV
jgi:hypothetical protein